MKFGDPHYVISRNTAYDNNPEFFEFSNNKVNFLMKHSFKEEKKSSVIHK